MQVDHIERQSTGLLKNIDENTELANCLIYSSALPANPLNMKFYFLFICIWVRSFANSDLPDTDNIVPLETTTPINRNIKDKIKGRRAD